MHTCSPDRARIDRQPTGEPAAPPRRAPASPSPAPPATPARNCCGCSSRHPASRSPRRCRRARPARRAALAGARARLWNGAITPLDRRRRWRATPTSCSSRCPIRRPPSSRRRWSTRACASSISPARSGCADATARARWYPETHRLPDGVVYGLTERERGAVARARLVANPGCYPTATLLALAPLASAGLLVAGQPTSSSTPSRACRAPARRRPSGRTSPKCTAAWRAYGVFGHRHGAEIEQGARPGGHLHAASGAARPRHSGDDLRPRARRARPKRRSATSTSRPTPARPFVRLVGSALPEIKHVAHTNFCDIGWRVDAVGRVDPRVGHRQPAQGRVGPGRAEHERDARHRRATGCMTGSAWLSATRRAARCLKFGGELLEDRAHGWRRSSRRDS